MTIDPRGRSSGKKPEQGTRRERGDRRSRRETAVDECRKEMAERIAIH